MNHMGLLMILAKRNDALSATCLSTALLLSRLYSFILDRPRTSPHNKLHNIEGNDTESLV